MLGAVTKKSLSVFYFQEEKAQFPVFSFFWKQKSAMKPQDTEPQMHLRPCPHDTFPNWARSIAPSSRPVARVHTGVTGTLVPDPRDHLSTWNEWARSIAIGCALSNLSCGRSSGRYRPVSKSAAVGTRLLDLRLPLLGTRALSRVFNRLRHVKADTRTLISKVLQSSKPYSHTNKINK